MKRVINASKQVGDITYFTGDINNFYTILKNQEIIHGKFQEYNPSTSKPGYSISFSRSKDTFKRDNTRWKFGIILDGTKLSDHYKVSPYSFSGTSVENKLNRIKIQKITYYDDNTYTLNVVNWKTRRIDKYLYEALKKAILDLPEADKTKHKLTFHVGTRKSNGHKIVEQYIFNNPNGDFGDTLQKASETVQSQFAKDLMINESEERIWLNSMSTVHIKGAIKGLILPKTGDMTEYEKIFNVLEHNGVNYTVQYY